MPSMVMAMITKLAMLFWNSAKKASVSSFLYQG